MLSGKPQFILVLIAWVGACGGDTSTTDDVPVEAEDSAGVRMVAYEGTPTAETPFRFPAEPRYRHGANPGDYAFRGINVGRLFPDGSAVVSDEWNSELVVLSPDGTTHEVLARRGEGPGEVTYAHAVFALGQDSVLVADPSLGRVTLFAGRSVASPADQRSWLRALRVTGIGSSGGLLLATRVPSERRSEFEGDWLPGHMARFDMETGALDTVASYDYMSRIPQGLEWPQIEAVGEVMVATGQFVYTRSDRPEVTWSLPDGTVTQIVRWQAEPAQLTEEMLEPVEADVRMRNRVDYSLIPVSRIEEITQEDMAWYRASIGWPLPLFGSPFADAEGNVWLPSYRPGGSQGGSPYTVISPGGEWLGTVEAPPRFRILDVAGGLVLGVLRDEMDVENVVVYEFVNGVPPLEGG